MDDELLWSMVYRPRSIEILLEKLRDTFPRVFRCVGTIRIRIVISEESVARIWINDDLVLDASFIEQFVELFDRANRNGLILIAEESEHGRFEFIKLVEKLLHAAPIKRANRVHRTTEAERQRHAPAEAKADTSDFARAISMFFSCVENFL